MILYTYDYFYGQKIQILLLINIIPDALHSERITVEINALQSQSIASWVKSLVPRFLLTLKFKMASPPSVSSNFALFQYARHKLKELRHHWQASFVLKEMENYLLVRSISVDEEL